MRILIAHNRYQQMGGEDVVFEAESRALEKAGHVVERLIFDNATIRTLRDKVRAVVNVSSHGESVSRTQNVIERFRPDVLHVHNFFPLLTPGAIAGAARMGVPVIQTLHNYRSLCANSMFLRDGRECRSCLSGSRLSGVFHRCYRGSAIGSFAINRMGQKLRDITRRYPHLVTLIALTNFSKALYVEGGFDASQIVVKANAVPDPGEGREPREKTVLFVGRLSPEKGVDLLCRVASHVDAQFLIIGDGPERDKLQRQAPANVTFLGPLPRPRIFEHMRRAAILVIPSQWYEACPMTLLEAFGTGTPVVASRLGSLAELVADGGTGLLADAHDVADWIKAITTLLSSPDTAQAMGRNARRCYLERYTEEINTARLLEIYRSAIEKRPTSTNAMVPHFKPAIS